MGNLLVAQSGGPSAVINASLAGIIEGALGKVPKILGGVHGIKGVLEEDFIDLSERFSDKAALDLLAHTPAAYLGTCRYKLPKDDEAIYQKLFDIFAKHDIEFFIYIGGNDSMDTVDKLSKFGARIGSNVKIVGAAKTIDNDLALTDHTPGFGSAAKYVATSMREIILDCKSFDRNALTVVEIMGRNAGWLTAAAALARTEQIGEPDFIYLPEVPFDLNKAIADIIAKFEEKPCVIVAISEGVRTAEGKFIFEYCDGEVKRDAFGHALLSGTALSLCNLVKNKMDVKTRAIEFSLLQRCAGHLQSLTDATEAREAGRMTAEAALAGDSAVMVGYKRVSNSPYKIEFAKFPVSEIANHEKGVPREWINDAGNDVLAPLVEYIAPLIAGENPPVFVDGLPQYAIR